MLLVIMQLLQIFALTVMFTLSLGIDSANIELKTDFHCQGLCRLCPNHWNLCQTSLTFSQTASWIVTYFEYLCMTDNINMTV